MKYHVKSHENAKLSKQSNNSQKQQQQQITIKYFSKKDTNR